MDVREVYLENLKNGMEPKDAAKLAQEQTGIALRSGRPFHRNHRSLNDIGKVKGQYGN
jgi:hypothetical protein